MIKNIIKQISALLLGMGLLTTAAHAESPISGDLGIYSQYVWRGMVQGDAGTSVQGDLGANITDGLSANVWFASPIGAGSNSVTEFDWTIDYSGEIEGFSYSAGYIYYSYLNGASGNTGEVYAGIGYGPVSTTYYYATNSNNGGWKNSSYLDVALAHSIGGFDLGANFGFYFGKADTSDSVNAFPTTDKGLGHVDLSISKDIEIQDVTVTPSLMVSIPTWKDDVTNDRPNNSNLVVAGVNFSY